MKIGLKELTFAFGLCLSPLFLNQDKLFAQNPRWEIDGGEYEEDKRNESERNGRNWKAIDDIVIKINRIYLDSLVDPLPPDDEPGRELRRYYLIVNADFSSVIGKKTIDPAGDFLIKDENGRKIFTGDYEGRDVNGYPKLGKRKSMYEKKNPGKLKKIYSYSPFSDEITLGSNKEFAVSRNLCFAIGENDVYGNGRRIAFYLDGNLWLCYGSGTVPLINLETFLEGYDLKEGYYEERHQNKSYQNYQEINKEKIFADVMNIVLSLILSKRPDLMVSYRKLNSFSFRSIERRKTGIDSVTHYFKDLVPVSDGVYKLILSNYSHYYNEFSEDSSLIYLTNDKIKIKVFDENGSIIDLEDAINR